MNYHPRQIIVSPMVYRLEVMCQDWIESKGLCVDPLPDRSIVNGWFMHYLPREVEEMATERFFLWLGIDCKKVFKQRR